VITALNRAKVSRVKRRPATKAAQAKTSKAKPLVVTTLYPAKIYPASTVSPPRRLSP
jgi:hypothetical protein